ncbi:Cytochrome b ascorbate-dependent protein 3 [Echinococcus granulosus]|uniref:Cytochrome b ascorbate-dependent protein 3 n=1 Tax=Echinococcus granulosus TaxID=6210 RepID=W6UA02_ECHGR|nr:Cytochrome b ascorbate-dependent protein 3 [Echinococcus granulosus]EUB58213.1 Cytochrome b ascorbate-dependent protein 3 [Echinococcus granulosus]
MSEGSSAEMNLRTYDSLDRPPNEEASKKRCLIPIAAIAQVKVSLIIKFSPNIPMYRLCESEICSRDCCNGSARAPNTVVKIHIFHRNDGDDSLVCSDCARAVQVVMCTVWMGYYYGGFDWRNPALVFNYHPVFMVIGMIFCFGDAMLIYRVFHKCPKLPLKAVHGVLMILGLLFSVVGFKAAFDSHNMRGIPDVYSIHSWIGLVTVVLFAVQWVVGLIAFLVPYIPPRVRSKILPLHTATGLFLLCCALVAAISGITEKNFGSTENEVVKTVSCIRLTEEEMRYLHDDLPCSRSEPHTIWDEFPLELTYKDLPAPAMLSNFMGVCLVVFCGMVFYLVHRHDYRRIEPTNGEQNPRC